MKKAERLERDCVAEALSALRAICADGSAKDADRVAAAKLLLEHARHSAPLQEDSTLRVVMDLPGEYLA